MSDTLTDEEAQAAFESASNDAPLPVAPAAGPNRAETKPAEPKQAEPKPPEPKPDQPEYVQMTKQQFEEFQAAAAKIPSYDKQLATAHGHIGSLQRTVNELRQQPAARVEISADDFVELKEQFPELAEYTRAGLARVLGRLPAGAAPQSATLDMDAVRQAAEAVIMARETAVLADAYPDWRELIGAVNGAAGETHNPDHPFQKWLGTKPEAYRTQIMATDSAAVLMRAIRTFQTETAPKPKPTVARPQVRTDTIREAIQPRGDNGRPDAGANDLDEAFRSGFAS